VSRALSLAFLIIGLILLIFGFNAADSFASEASEFFTGAPTNRSIWLTLIGVVLALVGAVGLARRR
jgi:LPXTG-motif cell wall-anchored protein